MNTRTRNWLTVFALVCLALAIVVIGFYAISQGAPLIIVIVVGLCAFVVLGMFVAAILSPVGRKPL